jgi:hypothetical protein
MHRESWTAWIGYGALSLLIFAILWFYVIFHLGLKIPLRSLGGPFATLTVLHVLFAVAGKISRERFINRGQLAPMILAVSGMFLLVIWGFGYYGGKLGFLPHDDLVFIYFGSPAMIVACGLGTYYFSRQANNREPRTPMILAVSGIFLVAIWGLGYCGRKLGFLSHDDLAFICFATPLVMAASGLGTYYFGRTAVAKSLFKIRR